MCIRFSNRELEPLWGAGLRFAMAAAVLVAAMLALRLEVPRGRALVGPALFGVLSFGAAFGLGYYGFVHVHAGLGQTVLALVPLATLLLAVAQRQERLHPAAVVGAGLAVAGVALMSGEPLRQGVPVVPLLALVGSAFCFGQAAIVIRRFPEVHPVTANAIAMACGAALLVAAAAILGERFALPTRSETWIALGYLVAVGSVLVFLLYLLVLRYWEASRASYEFVLIPFVTVGLSAWLDDERVGLGLVAGGLLVLIGVYVGALRPARAEAAAASSFRE